MQGPAGSKGYWNRPELTESTFGGVIRGDEQAERFLRTGDLGFFSKDQLVSSGRLKDVIIVRGQNHEAEDIEWTTANASPECRAAPQAAFSVSGEDDERLIIIHELSRHFRGDPGRLASTIMRAIVNQHGVSPQRSSSSGPAESRAHRAASWSGMPAAMHSSAAHSL